MMKLAFLFIFFIAANSFAQNAPVQTPPPAVAPTPEPAPAPAQTPVPVPAPNAQIPPEQNLPVDPSITPADPPANIAAPQSPEMTDPLLEGFFEDIGYTPTDKRDPFLPYMNPALSTTLVQESPLEPLQKFALNELKLIGIIWDVGKPKALIEDPAGKSYIVIENAKMGNGFGYVAAIREGEIIVVEPLLSPEGKKSFQTKVLKLSSIKGTGP